MDKKVILWTSKDCSICRNIKQYLKEELSCEVEEREADKLMSGEDKNIDVMAQLAEQNMELPVIQVEGKFVNPARVQELKGEG